MPRGGFVKRKGGTFFDIIGDEEHIALFKQLPEGIQRRSIRTGVRKGAMLLTKKTKSELKARTRRRTGNLLKSISWEDISKPKKNQIRARVYFSQKNGKKGYHAHLVEFGHRIVPRGPDETPRSVSRANTGAKRRRRRTNIPKQLRRGMVKGRGFFRAAINKSWPEIKRVMQDEYRKQLDKELRKKITKIAGKIEAARRAA